MASNVLTGLLPRWRGQPETKIDWAKGEGLVGQQVAGARGVMDTRTHKLERNLRLAIIMCFCLVAVNVIQAVENVRNSAKSHLIPYVIQTDAHGRIVNTELLKDQVSASPAAAMEVPIKGVLTGFVEDWRSVTTDMAAMWTISNRVILTASDNSEAANALLAWYRTHDPRERAKTVHVEAKVKNVVRIPGSDTTYQVYWEERTTGINAGTAPEITNWVSMFTVTINPPKEGSEPSRNTAGVLIERFTEPQREAK